MEAFQAGDMVDVWCVNFWWQGATVNCVFPDGNVMVSVDEGGVAETWVTRGDNVRFHQEDDL